ncbi:NYN domain-containing protein [Loktanella sp. Alg231-35]|uniref:NYN domain-containing protein n=1 Tax=Loktanella sp. Alg231-35 TaxID=1922220 RepID=UPI001F36CF4B|nr:hypothetical protein [Loktanella sp. Alg231-35]
MQFSDFLLLVPAFLGFVVLFGTRLLRASPRAATTKAKLPPNPILVDGSNVLYWGQEPSPMVLQRILRNLEEKGYTPIVFFDANVGYVLDDHYYDEAKVAGLIGVPARHVCVVNKGEIADEGILAFATDHNLRVVTNDKYRDWRVRFPHAAKKGILIGGTWRDGAVVWRANI